jgi:hypothetical protein
MFKSLWSFIVGILKKIYWLLPSLVLDPFDLAERFGVNYDAPRWLFWVLLGVGLFISAFLTYNDLKQKLDAISEEFFFEYTGIGLTTKNGVLYLNVTFKAKPSVIVDKLHLEINGLRIAPTEWKPFKVSPQYTNSWAFNLSGKVNPEETYPGVLVATIENKEYRSREFTTGL